MPRDPPHPWPKQAPRQIWEATSGARPGNEWDQAPDEGRGGDEQQNLPRGRRVQNPPRPAPQRTLTRRFLFLT